MTQIRPFSAEKAFPKPDDHSGEHLAAVGDQATAPNDFDWGLSRRRVFKAGTVELLMPVSQPFDFSTGQGWHRYGWRR